MATLDIKTVHNFHINDYAPPPPAGLQGGLVSTAPKFYKHRMFGYKTIKEMAIYMPSQLISRTLLLVACLPLLAIKHLPEPLHHFPVRSFYYSQWLGDLEQINSPFKKITYASARVVDACRLFSEYGILRKYFARADTNGCHCKCK